jgi:hypothetical protein
VIAIAEAHKPLRRVIVTKHVRQNCLHEKPGNHAMAQINAEADLAQPQNTAHLQQSEQRITSGDDHKNREQHDSGGLKAL